MGAVFSSDSVSKFSPPLGFRKDLLDKLGNYFPNTLTVSLLVLGLFLGIPTWIAVACGAIALIGILILFQGLTNTVSADYFVLPGSEAIESCSIVLDKEFKGRFNSAPSMWMAITWYYLAYIMINAYNVFTISSNSKIKNTMSVLNRKMRGPISMIITAVLLLCIIIYRFFNMGRCENIVGVVLGGALGIGMAIVMWMLLKSCGDIVKPDIHCVMIGTTQKTASIPV